MADVAPTVKQHESAQIEEAEALQHELEQAERALPAPSALEQLCAAFSLSPFERDVLLLCAGVELDTAFAELCARAQTGARCTYPTFSLALAALASAHWSALTPDAPLRRWRLIEVESGRAVIPRRTKNSAERTVNPHDEGHAKHDGVSHNPSRSAAHSPHDDAGEHEERQHDLSIRTRRRLQRQ